MIKFLIDLSSLLSSSRRTEKSPFDTSLKACTVLLIGFPIKRDMNTDNPILKKIPTKIVATIAICTGAIADAISFAGSIPIALNPV